jgi:hypothetical protein
MDSLFRLADDVDTRACFGVLFYSGPLAEQSTSESAKLIVGGFVKALPLEEQWHFLYLPIQSSV